MLPLESPEIVTQPTEQINQERRQQCNVAYQVFTKINKTDKVPIPLNDLQQYRRARRLTLRVCQLYLPIEATELIDVLIITKVIAALEDELTLLTEIINELNI